MTGSAAALGMTHGAGVIITRVDHAPAQANLAVIENEVLSRRRCPLRRRENRPNAPIARRSDFACRVRHPIARLCPESCCKRRRRAGDPMHVDDIDLLAVQKRMVVPLDGDQRVVSGVLAGNKPRGALPFAYAADTQTL